MADDDDSNSPEAGERINLKGKSGSRVEVKFQGKKIGTFTATGRIVLYGEAGNDTLLGGEGADSQQRGRNQEPRSASRHRCPDLPVPA